MQNLRKVDLDPRFRGDDEKKAFGDRLSIPAGRLVELSGTGAVARTTTAVSLLLQAQAVGESAAWIQPEHGPLFPPDLAESGVDLDALVVILVPKHCGPYAVPKAAELLLRSGGFGLVVLDLRGSAPRHDAAWQGRLLSLAREHESRVVLLTDSPTASGSVGPLVSLRIEPRRVRLDRGVFAIEQHVLKDKSGLLSESFLEERRGPWGLR